MTTETTARAEHEPTPADALYASNVTFHPHVERQHVCPACGQDAARMALVRLVYVFDVCRCGHPEWEHLMEQIWHRECYANYAFHTEKP